MFSKEAMFRGSGHRFYFSGNSGSGLDDGLALKGQLAGHRVGVRREHASWVSAFKPSPPGSSPSAPRTDHARGNGDLRRCGIAEFRRNAPPSIGAAPAPRAGPVAAYTF